MDKNKKSHHGCLQRFRYRVLINPTTFCSSHGLPDTLEAYFQETGRAGRDERKAYAILLYEQADIIHLENTFKLSYPELPLIQDIYQALCNYYRIPVGSGEGLSFEFDNNDFATTYKQNPLSTYHAFEVVEKAGLIRVYRPAYSNAIKKIVYNIVPAEDLSSLFK